MMPHLPLHKLTKGPNTTMQLLIPILLVNRVNGLLLLASLPWTGNNVIIVPHHHVLCVVARAVYVTVRIDHNAGVINIIVPLLTLPT